ncbi:hypothetical protein [Pseudidiomarina woesei]|uniref:Uncharacterized protein n=1 Tax=Pseudidiomarina woesei TaxID=1381080 RepID=A0A0K6H2H3_9GAMM|nr:hypothetical protein [Pseudidiomarina woesei]CUA85070.1 hypothetical protein Ga0061064_1098 [Pseudidiomarina woesei]
MIFPLLLAVIGFAAMLSGIWEQNLGTIFIGVIMQLVGWVWFYSAWRKAKKTRAHA